MLEEIAFVRLIPPDLRRRQRSEVQAIDVRRRDEPRPECRIVRNAADDQRRAKAVRQIRRLHLDDAREWKQELAIRQRMIGVAANHRWKNVGASVSGNHSLAASDLRGYVSCRAFPI